MNIFWNLVILFTIALCLLFFIPGVVRSKSEKLVQNSKEILTEEDVTLQSFTSTLSKEIEASEEAIANIGIQSTPQPNPFALTDETRLILQDESSPLTRIFEQVGILENEVKSAMKVEAIKFTVIRPRETEALLDEFEQRLREGRLD